MTLRPLGARDTVIAHEFFFKHLQGLVRILRNLFPVTFFLKISKSFKNCAKCQVTTLVNYVFTLKTQWQELLSKCTSTHHPTVGTND